MKTHQSSSPLSPGQRAEMAACLWLERAGYKILRRNWRSRYFEIDIIASAPSLYPTDRKLTVFFEVKYRIRSDQGYPEEFIDSHKLNKLRRGAETWISSSHQTSDYELGAVAVTGEQYRIDSVIVGL